MAALLLAIALLSNQGLRSKIATQQTQIETLETENTALQAAQVVLEETHAKRLATTKAMANIKENIEREEDADTPRAISRALDGLRDRAP